MTDKDKREKSPTHEEEDDKSKKAPKRDENEPKQLPEDDDEETGFGGLPQRDLKKNLGCG